MQLQLHRVPVLQEAVRLVQLARKEGGQARIDAALLGRLGELEAELTAALAKANRENAGVYLQVCVTQAPVPPTCTGYWMLPLVHPLLSM